MHTKGLTLCVHVQIKEHIVPDPMCMKVKKYILRESCFLILLLLCLYGCNAEKRDNNGFTLEEFVFDNHQLDSIVNSVVVLYSNSLSKNNLNDDNGKIIILELSRYSNDLLFNFVCLKKYDAIYKYIFRDNKRIVGYNKTAMTEIVLVSDIDDLTDFGNCFSNIMHPTGKIKNFQFLSFPKDLYSNGSQGWADFDLVFDPRFIVYRYDGKSFSDPISTTNIIWSLDHKGFD